MAEKIKSIEELMAEDKGAGLEKYDPKEEGSGLMFAKLLNALSKEVTDLGMSPGTLINSRTKEKLADLETEFVFIPLYYFKEYAILDEVTYIPIKRSQNKDDFTADELAWKKITKNGKTVNVPPLAGEFLNFVVVSTTNIDLPLILTFKRSDIPTGHMFRQKISDTMNLENMPMYGMSYALKVVKSSKDGRNWFGFSNVRAVEKISDPEIYLKLRGYNKEISQINYQQLLLGPADAEEVPEGTIEETTAKF